MSGLSSAHSAVVGDAFKAGFQNFVDQSATLTAVNGTPGAGQFRSSITGRAPIPDISNDLRASLGVERIPVQNAVQLQNEFGPSGEPVYAAVNDDRGLIRFVGKWTSGNSSEGTYVYDNSGLTTDYTEVVFYGTGLNVLFGYQDGSDRGFSAVYVDGTSTGALAYTGASVLNSRNYSPNYIKTVCSNLSLGVHTVRMMNVTPNTVQINGFEILNSNASGLVNINTGAGYIQGQKVLNSAADSIAYNAGVTGTRGGRVVRYLNQDGTVGQAVTLTNGAAAYLANADHTNEDVARPYHFREFGCGRADDFSLLTVANRAAAFTLEDGCTTLVCSDAAGYTANSYDALTAWTTSSFFTLTFVGTGLDISGLAGSASGTLSTYTVSVDGAAATSLSLTQSTALKTYKIVSGLPYGTHTVKFLNTALGATRYHFTNFIVYQPKKPAIPATALELCDYNVMGDYVANTVAGLETIAAGTLRKMAARERVYVNGTGGASDWEISSPLQPDVIGGLRLLTDRTGAYMQYTFFGTGFELRGSGWTIYSNSIAVTIDTLAATVANFPTLTSSVYGGFSFSSGVLNTSISNTLNSGLSIKGLPLGVHTVRFTNGTTSAMNFLALDIITPIHAVKSNLYADLQNTLPVGSQSLMDTRATSAIKEITPAKKAWAQAVGVVVGPTTTSTTIVPIADMSVTIKTEGGPLQVSFAVPIQLNVSGYDLEIRILVDGVIVDPGSVSLYIYPNAATLIFVLTDCLVVPVAKGVHKVDLYWRCGGGTLGALSARRHLTVQEI